MIQMWGKFKLSEHITSLLWRVFSSHPWEALNSKYEKRNVNKYTSLNLMSWWTSIEIFLLFLQNIIRLKAIETGVIYPLKEIVEFF